MSPENLIVELDLRDALGLFLSLEARGEDPRVEKVRDSLRDYLYGRLSIEDMENPERLYRSLVEQRHVIPSRNRE